MKPPFCYYGGKQRLAHQIVSMLPEHDTYVEPFFGGGAVFFEKNPSNLEVINDNNKQLINFFRVLRDPKLRNSLLGRLEYTLYSRAEFNLARRIIDGSSTDPISLAWAWYVSIEMSFSKRHGSSWSYMNRGTRVMTRPKEWAAKVGRLDQRLHERLKNAHVECDDALAVIKRFDSERTLFYLDPPYVGADQGPYKGYTEANLRELVELLSSIKGSFILSHYHHEAIPAHWPKIEIQTKCLVNLAKKTNRTEVLWFVGKGFNTQLGLFDSREQRRA